MEEGRVLTEEDTRNVLALARIQLWDDIASQYPINANLCGGTPVWWCMVNRVPDARDAAALVSKSLDLNVNALHLHGCTNFLWTLHLDPKLEPLWRILLERGIDVKLRDPKGDTILEHLLSFWRCNGGEGFTIPKLLIDYGCPMENVSSTIFPQLRDYNTRVRARKQAARWAAGSVFSCARRQVGRDLARLIAQAVWETRRERRVWQPVELSFP